MVHGHHFDFTDEPTLQTDTTADHPRTIFVKETQNRTLLDNYTLKRPWVPLSGREGQYFAQTPFEEADENFSWGLAIKDVLTMVWLPEEQTIYYMTDVHYTAQRLQFWVYHTFFPMILELSRSAHMLHVAAVEVASKPVLFSAPSFGGKSTLTDFFIQKGHTLLSDDSLGIEKKEGIYYCIPAYPYHRPYREPEVLGHRVENFALKAQSIDAVFLLKKAMPDADIAITELKGIEKFKAFHESIFIEFPFRKKERFRFFGEMAQNVPVFTVTIPWNIERLHEVYQAIIENR